MKQFLLPCALLFCGSLFAQTPILEEDFEAYEVGAYIGESSSVWSTWSGTTGTDEDGIVSDDYANSGTKSLNIFGSAAGGPMDVYLPMGLDDPYEVSFQILIPTGSSAYMNIQENLAVAVAWAFDLVFDTNGNVNLSIDETPVTEWGSAPFDHDAWNAVNLFMDPVSDRAEIYINGQLLGNIPFDAQIGGINFFGFGDGVSAGLYYIDDVVVVECETVGVEETDLALSFGPNPATDFIQLSSNTAEGTVRIMALNGQIVAEHYLTSLESGSRINLDLDNGIYLVELTSNDISTMRKLVVNR